MSNDVKKSFLYHRVKNTNIVIAKDTVYKQVVVFRESYVSQFGILTYVEYLHFDDNFYYNDDVLW